MKTVAFNPFYHLEYAREVSEASVSADTKGIVAIDSSGEPQGIVLLDSWSETAVTAHISITNPMALRTLHTETFRYVFETCGKLMIIGNVASNNTKARRLNRHFGFTELARIPNGHSLGVDILILQLLASECQYLNKQREAA